MNLKSLVPWRNRRPQATTRDDFFDPFVTFRREIARMFDDFVGGSWPSSGAGGALTPAVDVEEWEKQVVVTAELPGVSESDIEVNLAGSILTIKGEKKFERERREAGEYRTERRFGTFERSIRLPFEVSDEGVEAKFANGVLTVRVPKPVELQRTSRRIEIKAA